MSSFDPLNEYEFEFEQADPMDGFSPADGLMESTDGEFEFEFEDQFLGNIVGSIGSLLGGLLGQGEGEFEYEYETGLHGEATVPSSSEARQAAALMEAMVDQLAEAEGEGEVDQFLPILAGLAPLALKAAKVAAPLAKKALPHLARGVMNIGRRIARSPRTRQLVRTLPTIARNTAAQVAQHYARTGQLNGQTVTRALAGQAARVLRQPAPRRIAVQRNRRIANGLYRICRAG
jgi:hypothetical protein